MSSSVLSKFAIVASSAALLAGCAGSPLVRSENTSVSNRPENSGPKEYGSEACRAAAVTPVPVQDMNRGGRFNNRQYFSFMRLFRADPLFREKVSVTSDSGIPYALVSDKTESNLLTMAGMAGGAAVTTPSRSNTRGWGRTKDAAKTAVGAAIGGAIGRMGDDMLNIRVRENFDRCRLDVAEGAYDTPAQSSRYYNGDTNYDVNVQPHRRLGN